MIPDFIPIKCLGIFYRSIGNSSGIGLMIPQLRETAFCLLFYVVVFIANINSSKNESIFSKQTIQVRE